MKTLLALVVLMSVSGCTSRQVVIPDPQIPHQILEAPKDCVKVAVRKPGEPKNKWSSECVRVDAGWWLMADWFLDGELK